LFSLLALWPKVVYRIRGGFVRRLVILAGGSCGRGLRVERGFRLRQRLHAGIAFGANVYFGKDVTLDCLEGATLHIGDSVTFTQGIFISCCKGVEIGSWALIGEYTSIRDANHDHSDLSRPIAWQPMIAGPIRIGSDVWVGRGCAILSGVTIGDGAVIGANSVVARDIPEMAIAAGAPAKPIRSRLAS
jgi:acetyltransferase-like isoleucine patch superfamily enzyme